MKENWIEFKEFLKSFDQSQYTNHSYLNLSLSKENNNKICKYIYEKYGNDFILIKNLKYSNFKIILNDLKYPKYIKKNIPKIFNDITGNNNLLIKSDNIDRISKLYKSIEIHIIKYNSYVNSIFFPFVLYKICELIELDYFLSSFDIDNIIHHKILSRLDNIWEKICKDARWQYIPTLKFHNTNSLLFLLNKF